MSPAPSLSAALWIVDAVGPEKDYRMVTVHTDRR